MKLKLNVLLTGLICLSATCLAVGETANIPAPGTPLPKLPDAQAKEAYKTVTEEVSPLTPDQIKSLRRLIDDAERAAAQSPRFVPKPVSTVVNLTLQPGETPPVVRLGANFVTNVMFVDLAGNPINVTDVDIGGASAFTATWSKNKDQNIIKLSPKSTYAMGNISVSLEGVNTPASLTVVSGQREIDYRVDARIRRTLHANNNNSMGGSGSRLPSASSAFLDGLLEGVAPDGAKPLTSSTPDVQAWEYKNMFYVRTTYKLLSPAQLDMKKSSDGTTVYEIPNTPVIMVIDGGKPIQITLGGA